MHLYTPPGFLETFYAMSFGLAIFNTACLVVVLVWWIQSDTQLLRVKVPDWKKQTPADKRRCLRDLRQNYFYYQSLPLFVERSPIRIAIHRTSAPALGPLLLVLVVQSLPIISVFVGFWYAIHAAWHLAVLFVSVAKKWTPAPVKRVLFTPWF